MPMHQNLVAMHVSAIGFHFSDINISQGIAQRLRYVLGYFIIALL